MNLCSAALIILRKQSSKLLNILSILLVAELPCLDSYASLEYVKTALTLKGNDIEAFQNVTNPLQSSN